MHLYAGKTQTKEAVAVAKKKKRRLKKKYRILRGIYIAVVVIAAIIVIAYAALKFTVRAPEIKQPDDTGSQTSQ